jgi:hypothetical protein
LETGKKEGVYSSGEDWRGYKRHNEWEGFSLVYKIDGKTAEGRVKAIWRKIKVDKTVEIFCEFQH